MFGGGGTYEVATGIPFRNPFGGDVYRHYATAGGSGAGITTNLAVGTYTFSVWVAKTANTDQGIKFRAPGDSRNIISELASDKLTRVSITFQIITEGSYGVGIADERGDFLCYGFQLEQGSFPTSYIPTAGTQVTRAADDCSLTLGDEYNASEGTIYCELTYPVGAGNHTTYGRLGGLICRVPPPSGASFKNQFVVYRYLGYLRLSFRDAGRSGFDQPRLSSGLPINEGVSTKIAVSWKAGVGFTFSVAGATSVSAFSDLPAFASDYLSLTTAYDGSEFSGIKKDFRILPTALSEAELITLTGGT